jgi:glycerol-3-phosphate dehydrogenase
VATLEPTAMEEEVEFILATASDYLAKAPKRSDVLSVFAGIRPLIGNKGDAGRAIKTGALSRDHVVDINISSLVTICGGKWTTYRRMAEDCVDQAANLAKLPETPCVTKRLRIHGSPDATPLEKSFAAKEWASLAVYGSDAPKIRDLIKRNPALGESLHAALPFLKAEVIWAVKNEMARTIEDVLARRTRALFLNARAAMEMAPIVANLMASDLGWDNIARDKQVDTFRDIASNYILKPTSF